MYIHEYAETLWKCLPVVYKGVLRWMISVHVGSWKALINENHNVIVNIVSVDFKIHPISELHGNRVVRMHSRVLIASVHDEVKCEIPISNWNKIEIISFDFNFHYLCSKTPSICYDGFEVGRGKIKIKNYDGRYSFYFHTVLG